MNIQMIAKNIAKAATANILPDSLFHTDIDEETTIKLFHRYVRVVEIENHSYCNRTCSFCPNVLLDRRSSINLMTDDVFEKILSALAKIDYQQTLIWSRYHEPMAHQSFFDRIHQARIRLPKAHLVVVSNGDYLNRERIRSLEDSRVDHILLDIYLPEGKERDLKELERAITQFQARTGLRCVEKGSVWEYVCTNSTVNITIGVPYYSYSLGNISTRGGLIDVPELRNYQRRSVCFNPLHSLVVDYNGKGMLCCQVRSDARKHASAIVGDLSQPDYSLFNFYRDLAGARLSLLSPGPKKGPCKTCTISDGGPDKAARRPPIASLIGRIEPLRLLFEYGIDILSRKRKWES